MSRIRAVLAFAVMVLFGVAGCSGDAVLQPDSSGEAALSLSDADCDVVVSSSESVQSDGVDAASSGETVCVDGGTHTEQVVINKDLTLLGFNGATIQSPSNPPSFTLAESGTSWEPIVFAFGGSESSGDVSGSGTVDVSISGFNVDGADQQPDADRLAGILYRNVQSSDGITENTVDGLANGGKRNFGIVVFGDSDVTISSNTVTDYERGGIFVTGGEGGPAPTGKIRGNEVIAFPGGNWAPNGIQIGGGAQGDVRGNTVKDNVHPDAASGAILVVESDKISVKDNTAENNDYGVGVFTFFPAAPSADNNKVVRNDVSEANDWGVIVGAFTAETTADNNKISNNTLQGDDGSAGVLIFGTAENNKVIGNTITGFGTEVVDAGDDSKVQANADPATQ